ncbi:hypothetical protein NIES4073_02750 (plasmid) [Kalymmatonema gypsitolerans NIES-4073]|nr:hypothetical protein NIES4073_02750 [Scytonema sp. NIES-4073]
MAIDKAIQLAERYDQELIKMEDAAIKRMNKALDAAFRQLDKELTKSYDNIGSNATILQAQRKALILQQLGSLLQIVRPQDAKMYQSVLQNLIDNSIDAGADLGGSLIKTINPAVDVKPFADVPIEAVVSASKNAYERLQRHGETFASTATAIIDQGLIQGWGTQKIRQPLQQQLGITKSRAEMIARTETIAAYNDAADQRYTDAEIEGVLWIAIGDKRVCSYCLSRHMKVYKRGSMRPPLHPSCRCTLAPVNMAWIEAGIVDVNTLRSERQRALEEAIVDPKEEPAPFERAAGIKSLPKPIYIPVITVPPKPVITSGSAEIASVTPKAKTKRTPKHKQPSINYSVNRYNPEELIQLGAKFTEQNLKIPEISDRERQLKKALANARQKLQEEVQAGSPSPKTIDAFRKAENAYYKEQEKRQEAETKEYDKLRQAIKKKHGELDAQALVDKINFQNLGEITTQTLKSTYQDFFELTGGKGARSIKTLKYDDPRAYASRYDNTINIGKGAEKGTQFHEAGHHVEYESKDLQMAMNIWRNQRAYSLQYKSLKELTGIDYDDDEVALENKYLDPYVGKVYANDSTEVLSMGIEHFTDAKAMRRLRETDKQHFDLIMGVILADEN